MHKYLGSQLRMFFEEENVALLQQIDAAFEKVGVVFVIVILLLHLEYWCASTPSNKGT